MEELKLKKTFKALLWDENTKLEDVENFCGKENVFYNSHNHELLIVTKNVQGLTNVLNIRKNSYIVSNEKQFIGISQEDRNKNYENIV